ALLVAFAPGMVLHGTVSWDLAAAAMAGLALLAWSRRRPALAGVALGIGAAVKLYPILFLLPLLVLCLRRREGRRWIESFVTAVGTWVFCNGVAAAMAGTFVIAENEAPRNAILRFFMFNRDRPADWDSVWFVIQAMMRGLTNNPGWAIPVWNVNLGSAVLLVAGMAAMAAVLWTSRFPASLGQAAFLATAIFVLTSKVFSPQFCIWLIPLAVLAGVKWTPFLIWQVVEVALVYVRFSYFHHLQVPSAGLPLRFFVVAIVVRDATLLTLVYSVVRDIRRPPGGDPPPSVAGGPATNRLVPTTSAA
ncbi:MAG TPA: glycosyltransferase 87 family protein, partial [Acidimicrobiales bacterium]|nr:glycosyltransferase 87 family protein [Acidimicrobiales bacterium]